MLKENSDYQFCLVEEETKTRMVALGIGGMGKNAMENLAGTGIDGLEIFSINTDKQALANCLGSQPIPIGFKRTGGKGAGGDSEVGRLSAEDDADRLRKIVAGAELVFVVAGMGGGTGTGAAPVIAKICRELGILTVGVVTTPMICEGKKRMEKATNGLNELRREVDSLVVIENEKLSLIMDSDDISIIEVFKRADNVLVNGINSINNMINSHGYINLDLADLRNVLKRPSKEGCADALISVGTATGENRAEKAAMMALENPLLANGDIKGADNLLINVSGDENMGLNEAHGVVRFIAEQAGEGEREIFMGIVTDNSLGDKLSVTLIATGSSYDKKQKVQEIKAVRSVVSPMNEKSINERALPHNHAEIEQSIRNSISGSEKRGYGATGAENFGSSPLISQDEWQEPAYARRQCRYSSQEFSETERSYEVDVREELKALKLARSKNRRIYREPALRMAC